MKPRSYQTSYIKIHHLAYWRFPVGSHSDSQRLKSWWDLATVQSPIFEVVDADHTDFCALGDGEVLWFNGSTPTILDSSDNFDLPVPNVTFPYRHFGSTYGVNATQTYVYHQVNDSTIAEEVWEKQSSLWQRSKNISIEVSWGWLTLLTRA